MAKKYIVTDPGFLVPDDDIWEKFSEMFNAELPSIRHAAEKVLEIPGRKIRRERGILYFKDRN